LNTRNFALLMLVVSVALSGCYINKEVAPSQVGVELVRNELKNCVTSGVYTGMGFWDDLTLVSMDTLTFKVSDPEVATNDNQLVGIEVTIQSRRKSDCESVKGLLTNWSTLNDDNNLIGVITATALEGIKVGTRQFTLAQLLDDRNGLSGKISEGIEADASKYSTEIINVTVSNIALAPDYASMMQSKALLTAEIDLELRRQDLIIQKASNDKLEQDQRALVLEQKLFAEQAQTAVDVEIASREGKKTAASYQVYLDNPAAYELEQLTRYATILGDKSVFYFLPEGTDLTMLFGNNGLVPLQEAK
jgi:hypothetical protein